MIQLVGAGVAVLLLIGPPEQGLEVGELDLMPLLMGLFGGLALFLFGMEQMATALKAVAGSRMKEILGKLTTNRFLGVVTGAFVTAVIQSSSVTTVLVVGFISAGLMTLAQSIGVILGADIGTTITAQIIAFKVTKYALLLITIGFTMDFLSKKEMVKHRGKGIMGLGLVFFGMSVMGEAMSPLSSYEPFLSWMAHLEVPVFGIIVGAIFTALIQSSSAMTGVVIVMASQGLISLPAGVALVFGANIGTCITALLASIGKPRVAVQAAVAHILFKVVGVLIWIAFIDHLVDLVVWLSPVAEDLTGAAKLAAESPRQIANAHTVFNVANTLIFLPFAPQFARLVEWLVPEKEVEERRIVRAKYLDDSLLSTPDLAIDRARLEILHMGDKVRDMLRDILPAMTSGTRESLQRVEEMDDAVDVLHSQIVAFFGRISQRALSASQTAELMALMEAAKDLESMGDVIETNLVAIGIRRVDENVQISDVTRNLIQDFHATVSGAAENALLAVTQRNERAAQAVLSLKKKINRMSENATLHHVERLVASEPNRLTAYAIETDILSNLKRIYYFSRRMARAAAPAEVAFKD
jgi:phosphate:Na+ symporter